MPKTIDNDIVGTTSCFGFDTAVSFATDAIDRLHTTAEAHRRIMVVEVMGRYAGWIALHAGVAGGADVILIPEIPYDLEKVASAFASATRWGAASASSSSPRAPSEGRQRLPHRGGARRPRGAPRRGRVVCANELEARPARKPATSCSATFSAAAPRRPSTDAGDPLRRQGG